MKSMRRKPIVRCDKPFALFILIPLGAALCQQPTQPEATGPHNCSEVLREVGWTIPGLAGAKEKSRHPSLGEQGEWTITEMEPTQPEGVLTSVKCLSDSPNRIEVDEVPIKVLGLTSYEYRGHLFAYKIYFVLESLRGDGTRVESASESGKYFIDIDGSGRFTLMVPPKSLRAFNTPPVIPDWVKSSHPGVSKR
jgi:hypothetical protein